MKNYALRDAAGQLLPAIPGIPEGILQALLDQVQEENFPKELPFKVAAWLLAAVNAPVPEPADFSPDSGSIGVPGRDKAIQAAAVLRQRLANPPTLRELAKAVLSNRSGLQESFKQVYHTTVARYSQNLRLQYAQILLMDPSLTLDDISDETGYYDGANLSIAFKKQFGYSPGEYRRVVLQMKEL